MQEENYLVKTKDGSNTLFSKKYNQHFHNIKDGSLSEALNKHIIPALTYHQGKNILNILDICYGLGYNTLASIYYVRKNKLQIKLNIYSVELDFNLVKSLKDFVYPQEFKDLKNIIEDISTKQSYEDENIKIELKILNARTYIKSFPNKFFDIVYQDAFSSEVNPELWTKEYFDDIYRICKEACILTTYSISTKVRLSLYEASFFVYEYLTLDKKISLAFKEAQDKMGILVNLEEKKLRNKEAKALRDDTL